MNETINKTFKGPDGTAFNLQIVGDKLFVNGALMQAKDDSPCEYCGMCQGSNENCSYQNRDLPNGCAFYQDRKEMEEKNSYAKKAFDAQKGHMKL